MKPSNADTITDLDLVKGQLAEFHDNSEDNLCSLPDDFPQELRAPLRKASKNALLLTDPVVIEQLSLTECRALMACLDACFLFSVGRTIDKTDGTFSTKRSQFG
jgi:hypothetical protein